ncbi:MAG TPA: NIPSNAP family protein [Sphingomicrobium sp.]
MMLAAILGAAGVAQAAEPHPVIELRQYKITTGDRDRFIELFEREFIETQEAEGMTLLGQFRDRSDPDRFTWVRSFPDMGARQRALTSFYLGPFWQSRRATANPMLVDNDNVLLMRPAWPGSSFSAAAPLPAPGAIVPARLTVVSIHYLWKAPDEGFTAFFRDRLAPALDRAGIPVEAALVREETANNFPRLPVREGEKLFLWATRVSSEGAWKTALARLESDPQWPALREQLFDLEERPPQRLFLDPTPRSRLR